MKPSCAPLILLSVNTAWNAWNFRSGLIDALLDQGYRVLVAAPHDRHAQHLRQAGCGFVDLPMDSNGTHPGRDLRLFGRYLALLRREAPLAYLGYTIKPNIYGSLAARRLGIPVINNIAGLGAAFIDGGMVSRMARLLYRQALRRSFRVFFQNPDDHALFTGCGLADPGASELLPGSGIALHRYRPQATVPACNGNGNGNDNGIRFLLVGRMLINKGVLEFAEAARIVRRALPQARFALLGPVNAANPNTVPPALLSAWQQEGRLDYLGAADDVRPQLEQADCVVLPSYREGLPRTLLEGAAMARPLIATDVPGCRAVVEHGVNGLLCRARDAQDLARQMLAMAALPAEARQRMGQAGRRKMEREFDEALVIGRYLDAIAQLSSGAGRRAAPGGDPLKGDA